MIEFKYVKREQEIVEGVTEANLQKYKDKHGEERAAGYVDAIMDFVEQADYIFEQRDGDGYGDTSRDPYIRKHTLLLFLSHIEFLATPLAQEMAKLINRNPDYKPFPYREVPQYKSDFGKLKK